MNVEQIPTSQDLPRRRRKAASTLRLKRAIVDTVGERAPITVRGVCYALFTMGLITDMSVNNTGKISRVMTEMRESGALDWTLIVDGSRAAERVTEWCNTSSIINAAVKTYRRDKWQDQPTLVEVWSEKSTVQGVLAPVLDELGVTFRVMKGFGSFTAVRQAAEDSMDLPDDRTAVALDIGDWDPSGLYMREMDLPARLARYGSQWEFQRIALKHDDLTDLPHFDMATKAGDVRLQWYLKNTTADPRKSWELDALNPNELRDRVRDAVEGFMDMDTWNRTLEIEAVEKQSMRDFHAAWSMLLGGGCMNTAVLSDVKPQRRASVALDAIQGQRQAWNRQHRRPAALTAREALAAVRFESMLIWTAIANLRAGVELTPEDWDRVTVAMRHVDTICGEVIG